MALKSYFVFVLDEQYYAVAVASVRQVIRAVKLTDLARGPELLSGLLNYHGRIIPVINIRKQLELPEKSIRVSDRIVIVETDSHIAAFIADAAVGVIRLAPDATPAAETIYPQMSAYVTGVSRIEEKTVLLYDTTQLIPPKELDAICSEISEAGASL